MRFLKRNALLQNSLQIMLSVVKHQIHLPSTVSTLTTHIKTLVLRTVAGYNFYEVDDIFVLQLLENFDFSHGCDWKALFVYIHLDHLQSVKFGVRLTSGIRLSISNSGFEYFAECTLANHRFICENLGSSQVQVIQVYSILGARKLGLQNYLLVLHLIGAFILFD